MKKHKSESGQGLIEYMILLALVVIVCVAATRQLGQKVSSRFREIESKIDESVPIRIGQ